MTASFDPAETSLGSTTLLTVEVHSRSRNVVAPELVADGMVLRRMGAVHRVEQDGGVASTFTYLATPSRTGTLSLDPAVISVEGELLPLPTAVVAVHRAAPPPAAAIGSGTRQLLGQIRLVLLHVPDRVYAGEVIPMELALTVPDGLRFRIQGSHPLKIGDGFALGSPADPLIGAMVREKSGPSPEQLRWRTLVTARREGNLPLAFVIGLSVETLPPNLIGGGAGQGWKTLFQASPEWMPITVLSEQQEIEVIPLPEDGRPAGFCGAIGQFSLLTPEIRKMDENGTVEVIFPVRGAGNLPTIPPPNLAIDGNWRLGGTRKSIHLEDSLGHRATVAFHYTLIPTGGAAVPPPFQLSYFDPATGGYATLRHKFVKAIGGGE